MLGLRFGLFLSFVFSSTLVLGLEKETVRVRLVKDLRTVHLSGVSLRFQQDGKVDPYTRVAIPRMQAAQVVLSELQDGSKFFWQVKTSDKKGESLEVFSDVLHIHGHRIKVGLEPVPSRIRLERNRRGQIDVITELQIESYLAGVLPSEMPASWPIEALKAQAVASRTYMRKKMLERAHIHFDLEASVHDQVFKALNLNLQNPHYRLKIQKALSETRQMVLTNSSGGYLTAYYHSDCGGRTESPEAVWGLHGDEHVIVQDQYCSNRSASKWRASFARQELSRKLARHFKIFSEPQLNSIFVTKRTPGGRVGELTVVFDGQLPKRLSAQEFRSVMGFHRLKSTRFQWVEKNEVFKFTGTGNGHGVGLCQWGARKLAQSGRSFHEILEHYYKKAKLVKADGANGGQDYQQFLSVPQLSQGRGDEEPGGRTPTAKSL